ncbi:carboxypeptidase-like regulatory domain-containing protein [Pedobacter sp. 22226]|uniref:carboxypeptidase-like regulatory domain-containing protein n=1 Tax=Pedobacter sp. 22226 TaxID=3453894 RepID=UPI003F8325F6
MIKILFKNSLIILLLFFSNHLLAQGLKGKVTDSAGLAIPGATVQVVGSKVGTSSDGNGLYVLKFPSAGAYKVRISFTGYQTAEVAVQIDNTVKTMDFALQDTKELLSDVVVVGSRSTPRTNIESVVPVDLISTKDVKVFAQTDLTQILNFVAPSFSSNR